jgi:hypothetical protein
MALNRRGRRRSSSSPTRHLSTARPASNEPRGGSIAARLGLRQVHVSRLLRDSLQAMRQRLMPHVRSPRAGCPSHCGARPMRPAAHPRGPDRRAPGSRPRAGVSDHRLVRSPDQLALGGLPSQRPARCSTGRRSAWRNACARWAAASRCAPSDAALSAAAGPHGPTPRHAPLPARPSPGGQALGHVERIATSHAVQVSGIRRMSAGQHGHGVERQRTHLHPAADLPSDITEQHPETMARIELIVAEGHHHQRPGLRDPPPQQRQDIERGLVGPVRVLDDDKLRARRRAQMLEQHAEDPLAACTIGQAGRDRPARWPGRRARSGGRAQVAFRSRSPRSSRRLRATRTSAQRRRARRSDRRGGPCPS